MGCGAPKLGAVVANGVDGGGLLEEGVEPNVFTLEGVGAKVEGCVDVVVLEKLALEELPNMG